MKNLSNPIEQAKDLESRYKLLYIMITVTSLIILSRLWYLQIIQGEELRAYSERNRLKETKIPAPRGLILDRNSEVLVDNLPGFEATITPQYASKLEETALQISPILNIPALDILKSVKKSRRENGIFRPVIIKENLSLDEVYRVKLAALHNPGLNINATILRSYPMNEIGAQLFGYVGEISKRQINSYKKKYPGLSFEQGDIIGKSGLEEVWEREVRGDNGIKFNEVDARGRGRRKSSKASGFLGLEQKDARPGNNLVLTIDKDIQKAAYEAMNREDKVGPRIGGIVAIKSNGEILAWVNTPSFDPNEFTTRISNDLWSKLINDPSKPLRNKIIQDHYPPGSTFKPFVALAALQEKTITEHTLIYSPGFIKFGRKRYHDASRYGYGDINVIEALERSSNVFFYKMGIQLGFDKIAKYAKLMGIGKKTNINLSNEKPGLMPTSEWKLKRYGEAWQPGENLSNAIGQGFVLTTPLQMALSFNAIGLEGLIYKPLLVKKIIDYNNKTIKEFSPELLKDVSDEDNELFISKKNFKIVKEGMYRVSNGDHGSARWYKIPGVEMAGKTGTVQLQTFSADQIYQKCNKRPFAQRHHGWFGAFAPAKKPEITVVVLAEHACSGSGGGAPVVRDVMRAYFEKYHPDWLKRKKPAVKKIAVKPKPERGQSESQ